jgi:hypothetical protein
MFQELYPDSAKRHQVHYAFAHKFLPQYVHQNPYAFFTRLFRGDLPGGPSEPTGFINNRWNMFENRAKLIPNGGMVIGRVITELTMSIHETVGRAMALVQMPKPEKQNEAFFVAIVLLASAADPQNWPHDMQARVFTLEAEDCESTVTGETGMVCEWAKDGAHKNFGFAIRAERDVFLQTVMKILQTPYAPAAASFDPVTGSITFSAGENPSQRS